MKYFLRTIIFTFVFIVSLTASNGQQIYAATEWDTETSVTVEKNNIIYNAYLSKDRQSSWIYQVERVGDKAIKALEFPKTIQSAKVTKIGSQKNSEDTDIMSNIFGVSIEPYHEVDGYSKIPKGIQEVNLPSTVDEIVLGTFCGFRDLNSIVIPDNVEEIRYATFYNCTSLKKVVFPAKLNKIWDRAFERCKSLNIIEIGKSSTNYVCYKGMLLTKDKTKLVWVQPLIDHVQIPTGVKTIGTRATLYSYVKKIYIPATVTSIENLAFNGDNIEDITISSSNTHYAKSLNCIYSKKSKRLVVAICKDGIITLPKEVKYLMNNVSIAGKAIYKLIIPKTFKGFKEYWYSNQKFGPSNIYFECSTPPDAEKGSFMPFSTYYVPKNRYKAYMTWYFDTEEIINEVNAYTTIRSY